MPVNIRNLSELIPSVSSANNEQNSEAKIINHTIQQFKITTRSFAAAYEKLASTSKIPESQSARLESGISFLH